MEGGIYVTFFEPGESFERELPPVGPLDHVVIRPGRLVADRRHAGHDLGPDVVKALHAEVELQRALGVEPGGPKRTELRVTAPDGVFVQFTSFDDERERRGVPELGPFAVVIIGQGAVEADGAPLANRSSRDERAWELAPGVDSRGGHQPDIAFRTSSTAYHPNVAPIAALQSVPVRPTDPVPGVERADADAPTPPAFTAAEEAPETERVFRETERRAIEVYSPPGSHGAITDAAPSAPRVAAHASATPTPSTEDGLRSRIRDEGRRRFAAEAPADDPGEWSRYRAQRPGAGIMIGADEVAATERRFELRAVLWQLRFVIIGLLLVGGAVYAFTVIRGGPADDTPQVVGVSQRFSSARWDYVVNGTQRVGASGRSTARGVYYVVRVTVTNRGTDVSTLAPSEFVLIDANGIHHAPESLSSGAYFGNDNPQSPFTWPEAFPAGRQTAIAVIFDIDPTLPKGMQLKVLELPNTTVRLD